MQAKRRRKMVRSSAGRLGAVLVGVTAALALVGLPVGASRAPTPTSAPAQAHVWLTTADGKFELTDAGSIAFSSALPTVPTAVVDPTRTFQTMDGFGGAITDSSAVVLYQLSPAARSATMRMLFDPTPGTDMPAAQEEKVIEALGPMLRAKGLRTRILAFDHNWSEHPNDIASTPPDETQDINDYPQEVLSSPAARWLSGTAYHCYFGDPSAMTTLHRHFPGKDIYFTECSGSQSSDPSNTFSDTLKWHSRNLIIGSSRNWAKTVINWNVALDPSGGPHVGGCATCTGIVTVGPGDTVTPNAEFYTLGHLSRFVKPGAVRVASTSFGTTGWNGQVMDVAFVNPDGTTVLVAPPRRRLTSSASARRPRRSAREPRATQGQSLGISVCTRRSGRWERT